MKQYTTPEQTAKLIELGFEKPKSIGGYKPKFSVEYEEEQVSRVDVSEDTDSPIYAYSIGELIEMLPDFINIWDLTDFNANKKIWNVGYAFSPTISRPELIDALFDMVVKLKEEGVI